MPSISLAAARINAKKTQEDTAKYLNVSKKTISNWENGVSSPSIKQANKLSDFYNFPMENINFFA